MNTNTNLNTYTNVCNLDYFLKYVECLLLKKNRYFKSNNKIKTFASNFYIDGYTLTLIDNNKFSVKQYEETKGLYEYINHIVINCKIPINPEKYKFLLCNDDYREVLVYKTLYEENIINLVKIYVSDIAKYKNMFDGVHDERLINIRPLIYNYIMDFDDKLVPTLYNIGGSIDAHNNSIVDPDMILPDFCDPVRLSSYVQTFNGEQDCYVVITQKEFSLLKLCIADYIKYLEIEKLINITPIVLK